MDTRSITTSQPAVACDVCGRTLLRGEQPDVFLASGHRRTVCELCVTRATHEGWLRESDGHQMAIRPTRRRRGRSLFARLRDRRDGEPDEVEPLDDGLYEYDDADVAPLQTATTDVPLDALPPRALTPAPASAHPDLNRHPRHIRGVPTNVELRAARALEVFNAGEGPRRVAGVARSLGPPWVAVRPTSAAGSVVHITVAWELCWYRYEVDLGEEGDARLAAQGLELDELPEEERTANAEADENGRLRMLDVLAGPGED